jgi:hypothetical protein
MGGIFSGFSTVSDDLCDSRDRGINDFGIGFG